MWALLNGWLNAIFDLYLSPFEGLSPTWQICALALPVALFALLVFRYTSNQQAMKAAKEKMQAYLLELRLFKDDLAVTLSAQRHIFRYSFVYMGHALVPMAVMIVPFILVIIQVEARYAFRSLNLGESAILTVTLDGHAPARQLDAAVSLPSGFVQETPPLRIDSRREIHWRLRAVTPGEHRIVVRIDDQRVEKRALVGRRPTRLSPAVFRANDIRALAYPGEPALDKTASVSAIHLSYPRSRRTFAGLSSASWTLTAVSMALSYALRGVFGVTF